MSRAAVSAPFLVPVNVDGKEYEGFVTVQETRSLNFRLQLPPGKDENFGGTLEGSRLFVCRTMAEMLKGHGPILRQRLAQCEGIETFCDDLRDIVSRLTVPAEARRPGECDSRPTKFYRAVIPEIDEVGWGAFDSIDLVAGELQLRRSDAARRTHVLRVNLPPDYPNQPPVCYAAVPDADAASARIVGDLSENPTCKWLARIIDRFDTEISRWQLFWDYLDDLDKNTWILEPETFSRSHSFRRIALGGHRSMLVEFDCWKPLDVPKVRLFGSNGRISLLQDRLERNIARWTNKKSARENLQAVLELELPGGRSCNGVTKNEEDLTVACGICYSFKLNTEIPEINCVNARCGKPFHMSCLLQWLRSDAGNQSLDSLYGQCPYCTVGIRAPMTTVYGVT